jgi:hypothetical protein
LHLNFPSDTIVASRCTEKISECQAVPEDALLDASKNQPQEVPLFQRFYRLIRPKHKLPENSLGTCDKEGKFLSILYKPLLDVRSKTTKLYSPAIDLDSSSDTIFATRCTAKLGEMLWDDALLDAQNVR